MKKKYILPVIFCLFLAALSLLTLVLPKKDKSENEKRVLSSFPSLSWENVKTGNAMNEFDNYLADHFAFRDFWVGLNSYYTLCSGGNGRDGIYLCKDGYLIPAAEKFSKTSAKRNLVAIDNFSKKLDLPAHILTVPTPGYVMEDLLPSVHGEYFDDELLSLVKDSLTSVSVIDIRDTFKTAFKNGDEVYYRTDHHTTGLGSKLMYEDFCRQAGLTPKEFTLTRTVEGFYGTNYSKSGLWFTNPDSVDIYEAEKPSRFSVTIGDKEYDSLFFEEKAQSRDKYEVFLDGNHDVTVIRNKDVSNGKKLMIIKDSYSHCFATFLAEHYEEIVLVDLRYYKKSALQLAKDYEINELLFLYGAGNLASSTDITWLSLK